MTDGPGDGRSVEDVLVAWFLALDRGESPDLDTLCGGDAGLRERVGRVLAGEPEALRRLQAAGEREAGEELPVERLGEYRLLSLLGRGGMGAVYLARQESLARFVALKVLERDALSSERARLRFRREAEVAAALEHPHIVPVYAVGEERGHAFIAMKWLSGPSLDQVVGQVPTRAVARIGAAVARALEEAHLSGIVHRDVKPANVILDGETPYVVDFGLARGQTDTPVTQQGSVPGTLPYLAPELLHVDAVRLDPRADVYALGATLYELLRGTPPFPAEAHELLMRQILFMDPPPLRLPAADRDLETIVLKALEKEPERRIQTAGALAVELQHYLDDEPIGVRPTAWLTRTIRLARRHRRASAVVASVVAAALALAALLALSVARERRTFARELERGSAAVGERAWTRALAILEPLRAERGEVPELDGLVARARAERALDRLFDAVLNRRHAVVPAELAALDAELAATEAERLHPGLTGLVRAAAAWQRGDRAGAAARVGRLEAESGPSLGAAALRALFDGDESWRPGDEPAASVGEHVLAALALRLSGRAAEDQLAELDRAADRDPLDPRVRYARALALSAAGDHAEAERILASLARADDVPREVWRNLARETLHGRGSTAARAILARVPRAEWTPVEALLELQSFTLDEDWDAFEAALEAARSRVSAGDWPGSGLWILEGEYVGHVLGRADEAEALFERALGAADSSVDRDRARASRFLLHADPVLAADDRSRADLDRLAVEGRRLLDELGWPEARGLVTWRLGTIELMTGDLGGFRRLEDAIALLPDRPGPRREYAYQALAIARSVRTAAAGQIRAALLEEPLPDPAVRAALAELPDELHAVRTAFLERVEAQIASLEYARYFELRARDVIGPLPELAGRGPTRTEWSETMRAAFDCAEQLGDWDLVRALASALDARLPLDEGGPVRAARDRAENKLRGLFGL